MKYHEKRPVLENLSWFQKNFLRTGLFAYGIWQHFKIPHVPYHNKIGGLIYDNSHCIYFIKRFGKKHFITMVIDYAAVTVTLPSATSKW